MVSVNVILRLVISLLMLKGKGIGMSRLLNVYREEIVPKLKEKFGFSSVMQVPRIKKITINMGVGEAAVDKKVLMNALADLEKIAGQKPVQTLARKSIAGFKI